MNNHRRALVSCLAVMLVAGAGASAQTPGPETTDTGTLIEISVIGAEAQVVVGLLADHPLTGTVREIADPPRLFIDFENVRPDVESVTPVGQGGIERIRVALNQATPPVTRVVLDLSHPSDYRVEPDGTTGEFRIIVGSEPTVEAPPATTVPRALVLASPASSLAGDYVQWFVVTSREVEDMLTASADGGGGTLTPLDQGFAGWQRLQQEVVLAAPPLPLQRAHELLAAAVNLGFVGTQAVGQSNGNQASALAGAALLLRQARGLVDAYLSPPTAIDQQ